MTLNTQWVTGERQNTLKSMQAGSGIAAAWDSVMQQYQCHIVLPPSILAQAFNCWYNCSTLALCGSVWAT
jgi:hypothetical protein